MHSTNNLPAACVIPVLRHYHSIAILKIIFSHTARSYIDVLFYKAEGEDVTLCDNSH